MFSYGWGLEKNNNRDTSSFMDVDNKPRKESEIFADLEALCSTPGYIHVLAYLSHRDNQITYNDELTDEDVANSYADGRTVRTEFSTLMGLLIKHEIDFDIPSPQQTKSLIEQTKELLHEMHECLAYPMLERMAKSFQALKDGIGIESDNPFVHGDVLREAIFYGGEAAYSFQYRDLSKSRYANDNEWLEKKKGFRIEDAYALAAAIPNLATKKFPKIRAETPTKDPSTWTFLPVFTFSLNEIREEAGLSSEKAAAVLDALTVAEFPANEDFTELSGFNLANALPIIKGPSGDYISLQSYGIVDSLYDSPFYWMAADKEYNDTAFKNRGVFTERFTAERLASVFGASNVHCNVNIHKDGEIAAEIDVLVTFANRTLVVQCKSKKLTLEARKGNDLQLRDDFKKSVQNSYDQAFICSELLCDDTAKLVTEDGKELALEEPKEIYPLCVVSDHYPALLLQAREFLKSQTTTKIQPPLVTDIFLMDVLSEMLSSPLRFLSYINRRVHYGEKIQTVSELTILAYHLRENLWVDDEYNGVMLDDNIAIPLDTAMTIRREGLEGDRVPKGILTQFKGTLFDRLIRSIEHQAHSDLIDLGFVLLTLSGDTVKNLNRGIEEISRQTRIDKSHHDLTMCFDEGKTGLTIHCGTMANSKALEKLERHCALRKYTQRADSWFGLAVRADDGMPKFGLNLEFPWKQSSELDRATENMARREAIATQIQKGAFKKRKIGRNEPCPCGSGLKYKKCCIDRVM